MKERLLQILKYSGFSATRLADEINVQRSGISHILSGRNQPSYDFLVKILQRFPELNAEWLLTGKGSMNKQQIEENTIVRSEPDSVYSNKEKFPLDLSQKEQESQVKEVTNVTTISKVILLNSNGTFDVYDTSKKD